MILTNKTIGNMLSTGTGPFNGRTSFVLFSSKTDRTLTERLSGTKLNSSLFDRLLLSRGKKCLKITCFLKKKV